MMKKKSAPGRKTVFYVLLFLLLFVCGCDGSETTAREESKEKEERSLQIGMIFDNFIMERWQRDRDVFVSAASELGAQVNVQNANGSVEEQIALVEYFIEKKVDVLVIVPIEAEPLLAAVRKAREEGIRIIAYDRPITGAQVDLYISFDNHKVGRLMGEEMAERLKEQDRVVMICGPVTDHNVSEVEAGFREIMEESNILIEDIYYVPQWKGEYAGAYVRQNEELMQKVQGIMCGNDNLAGQAIAALSEQRLAGEICVVAQDADLAACQRIVENTQTMTVYKPVEKLAARAAQAAVALAEGNLQEDLVYEDETGRRTPYICLEPVKVNLSNMEEIIEGGFHLREDVYLNRPNLLE